MSPALTEAVIAITSIHEYPKKTILLPDGQVANDACFIIKGLVRAFYTSGDKEITRLFMEEGYVATSWLSFFTRQPAHESLETLEDTVLARLHHDDIMDLYERFPEFNIIGRKLTEYFFFLSEQRNLVLRTPGAEEKYLFFLEKHPGLYQRVSQRLIATYLGMNEETLSRTRAKMLKKSL